MSRKMNRIVRFLLVVMLVILLAVPVFASESFEILKLEQKGANHVLLEWEEYSGADGYSVYRSKDGSAFYAIKDVTLCSTYNYSLEQGRVYAYKVCPYRVLSNGNKEYLAESESVSIQIGVKTPKDLVASVSGKTSVSIRWSGDAYADYYMLYRSTDNSNWTLVKSVYGTSTVTYGLKEGETYYFRVKAIRNTGNVARSSDYSESVKCTLGIAAPSRFAIKSANKNSVELEWENVPGASGYRLYRAENDGAYTLIKTVTGTGTKNYNLRSDVSYTYRIAAIAEGNGYTVKSEYVYTDPIRLQLDPVENVQIEKIFANGVGLRWDPVEGATAYRLYRTDEAGNTALVKTIAETKTNTYSLVNGQCYRFSVKPICQSGTATVNGNISDETAIFFAELPQLVITQNEINKIQLRWNQVTGAEKYLLNIQQAGDAETVEELLETQTEYILENAGELTVCLQAVKGEAKSAGVNETFTPVYEETLSFAMANAIGDTKISIAWEPADYAVQYELQRFDAAEGVFATVGTYTSTGFIDESILPNTEYQYRYRVQYANADNMFWGNWSETVTVKTESAPKYRALLIGEENYNEVLDGPINDIEAMENMLSGLQAMDWEIYSQADATRDEIISLISVAFADATENDVSLFYFSGHGVTQSGDYYAGALMPVDYVCIPMRDLAELLSAVPGKVIVLLDSCGSGAAISGGTEAAARYALGEETFDPASFNDQVVEIFSQYNAYEQDKAGDLATDKFYVLTSSAYEENSRSIRYSQMWGGVFTRAFVACAGYDFESKTWSEDMHADENGDDCLTLNECYTYCYNESVYHQNVQVYPRDSSVRLLFK